MAAFGKVVLRNCLTFSGRASRPEFRCYVLAIYLLCFAANIAVFLAALAPTATVHVPQAVNTLIFLIFAAAGLAGLALLLPGLAAASRRLHDAGRSAWWLLPAPVPMIGFPVLLVFLLARSEDGPNRHGPPEPWTGAWLACLRDRGRACGNGPRLLGPPPTMPRG
ncbi:DUF805 domain-containing protein [Mangrovicoccus ximenensis]|uniref:DUF805 domain-containing protein n=1 Tax=Mangrovicoccus ximenensis TaxID=1911570 RepID=UPI000D365CC0|nr:DUF805 domain-containing protein [Mangrovicoccus ximenensis]